MAHRSGKSAGRNGQNKVLLLSALHAEGGKCNYLSYLRIIQDDDKFTCPKPMCRVNTASKTRVGAISEVLEQLW